MAEVIDLLSSSPPQPQRKDVSLVVNKTTLTKDVFTFDSDDFNSTGDFDFFSDKPSKRRKISPPPLLPGISANKRLDLDDIFNLSSDENVRPEETPFVPTKPAKRVVGHEIDTDHLDSFRFSSSAPELTSRASANQQDVFELSSDDDRPGNDRLPFPSQPDLSLKPTSFRTSTNPLAELLKVGVNPPKQKPKIGAKRSASTDLTVPAMAKFKRITKPSAAGKDDIIDSSQSDNPKRKAVSTTKQNGVRSKPKTATKTMSKADREAEKEAERKRKQEEKEQKAQEKQKVAEIVEVNKSKTHKKNATSEMIVDMPVSLQRLSIGKETEQYLEQNGVTVYFASGGHEEVDLISETAVSFGHLVQWRRKVVADYDEDLEIWKPLPQPRVTREKHVLLYLKAEDFVKLAFIGHAQLTTNDSAVPFETMKNNLNTHIQTLRARYPKATIIYLIEGLSAWNRKSQTVKNRAYTAAVRAQTLDEDECIDATAPSQQSRRKPSAKRKKTGEAAVDLSSVTPEITESLLLHLQLHHQPLLIHHTTSSSTSATQILTFTQHLSTRPYRLAEQNHNLTSASFCMTTGQIRTGSTPHETYINMLQEVNRVTPSMAYGISSAGYKNVGELVRGFREKGNLMLEDVRKSVNRDGGWSDRRLGPMVSRRLCKVFMGTDPEARDGIA